MIDGKADSYKSNLLKKADPKKHKTDKKKLKRKKKIQQKEVVKIGKD